MSRGARASEKEERTSGRNLRRQVLTWVGHWIIATVVLVVAVVLRIVATIGVEVGRPAHVDVWPVAADFQRALARISVTDIQVPITLAVAITICSGALAWRALAVGRALGRKPVFYRHVAVTVAGIGVIWVGTMAIGITSIWMILAAVAAYGTAVSWNLHRTDALRASSRDGGEGDEGWGEILGLARSRPGRPIQGEYTTKVPIRVGPGETLKDVEKAIPLMDAATGAIEGRSRLEREPGGRADAATVVLMHTDAFRQWRTWPGLSHPGGSIADGERTAYYDDGEDQQTWFVAGTDTDGQPRSAGHRGRMGMTRSGKSGDQSNEIAEVASRRDTVLVGSDSLKGPQGFGWANDARLLSLYADTETKAKTLFVAVNKLVVGRARRMAAAGYRDWSPEVYEQTGMAAVVWFLDEADSYIGTPQFSTLAKSSLSVGVFLSVALPRADTASMPALARFSIAAWKCYGVGDSYSMNFALTEATRNAGANPENWRTSYPGAHYLDTQPGVDPARYPVPCRSYRSNQQELAVEVLAARQGFTPAQFTPEDIADLGGAWALCQPHRAGEPDPEPAAKGATVAGTNGKTAQAAQQDVEDEDGEETYVIPTPPDDVGDLSGVNPRDPIRQPPGPVISWGQTKPRPKSPEEMAREFDRVLVEMHEAGIRAFTNADVMDRCTKWSPSWLSRRLSAVAEGETVSPPGLTIERIDPPEDGMRYRIISNESVNA